ncbi:MAG: hypothetical protein HC940_02575 [Acaryochloris sp. SU_5_25]|nr:hypothetical protein [Acaryochloris sp. SU_5_25]
MTSLTNLMQTNKLAVNILIKEEQDDQVSALVLGLPECRVVSRDRTSAIAELEQKLTDTLSGGEVVALEVEIPTPEHPWQKFAGIYRDSVLFEAVLENIATNRRLLNEKRVVSDEVQEPTM